MAGTTESKLEYLIRSKEDVRLAINRMLVPCPEDTPFIEYGPKIKQVDVDLTDSTVTSDDLMEGVIAYNSKEERLVGTIPDNGPLNYEPSDEVQIIPYGRTDGGQVNKADITKLAEYEACLTLANSIDNLDDYTETTATAEDILEGKTAYSNGERIIGTMESRNAELTDTLVPGQGQTCYLYQMIKKLPDGVKFSGTSALNLFRGCINLIEIPTFDTKQVTNANFICAQCSKIKSIPEFDFSSVTTADNAFAGCTSLEKVPSLNLSNATVVKYLFARCKSLKEIGTIDISKGKDLECLFLECENLTSLPKLITTSSVTSMYGMFMKCKNLSGDIVIDYNMSNVTDVEWMFQECSIKTIKLPSMPKVTSLSVMFYNCSQLERFYTIDAPNITSANGMLSGCTGLTDEGLEDVLQMCLQAVKITNASRKTLKDIGLTSDQATRCQSLSSYQAFIDTGWTTGY